MRLLRLNIFYPAYLRQFYGGRLHLAEQPYEEQRQALLDDGFLWADFWSVALRGLGYEAEEIVANVESLQKRWAAEHGVAYGESSWLFDIVAAQVKAFRPDVLFIADYAVFTAEFIRQLKTECPSIKLTLGWCGAPYRDASVFHEYDIVLSCIPELVEHFREEGHTCYHVNHAFDPRVLEKIDTAAPPSVDFAFVGSIVKRTKFHEMREKLLVKLVKETDLQLATDVPYFPLGRRLRTMASARAYDVVRAAERAGIPRRVLGALPVAGRVLRWRERPMQSQNVNPKLKARARPPLYGLAMFQQLHDTRVALNTHIDISPVSASNLRLFEATGVGTCLLTDWKENIHELFEPDVEVVTYRDAAECIEKVRYLLAHDEERRAIAAAGQRRTLSEHTFKQRAAQLDEIVKAALSAKSAARGRRATG
ncbi:MAG TPA: glycosyltransferase [Pyrinomonadaceae bacterium]|nr:glycosyltransferase [Pyrinomonadaceae bacterium]